MSNSSVTMVCGQAECQAIGGCAHAVGGRPCWVAPNRPELQLHSPPSPPETVNRVLLAAPQELVAWPAAANGTEVPAQSSLAEYSDEQIAQEYHWRTLKKLGDPRVGVTPKTLN